MCGVVAAAIDSFMRRIPDRAHRILGLAAQLRPKCQVLYFPIAVPEIQTSKQTRTLSHYEDLAGARVVR